MLDVQHGVCRALLGGRFGALILFVMEGVISSSPSTVRLPGHLLIAFLSEPQFPPLEWCGVFV